MRFDSKQFNFGWPVLKNEWKELFPADFESKRGHKMWMVAADGGKHSGPYGIRCWKGNCAQGDNFVGKLLGGQTIRGRKGSPPGIGSYQLRNWGANVKDGMGLDTWCNKDAKTCNWKYCGSGIKSICEEFSPDGWRYLSLNPDTNRVKYGFGGKTREIPHPWMTGAEIKRGDWKLANATSCAKFYAPELKTVGLEIGLSPDAKVLRIVVGCMLCHEAFSVQVPAGWVQYPLDPTSKYGGVHNEYEVTTKWARSVVQCVCLSHRATIDVVCL